VRDYTDTDELVEESMNSEPLLEYIVRLLPAANDGYEVGVFKATANALKEDEDEDWSTTGHVIFFMRCKTFTLMCSLSVSRVQAVREKRRAKRAYQIAVGCRRR
jgi:hypothetical protein